MSNLDRRDLSLPGVFLFFSPFFPPFLYSLYPQTPSFFTPSSHFLGSIFPFFYPPPFVPCITIIQLLLLWVLSFLFPHDPLLFHYTQTTVVYITLEFCIPPFSFSAMVLTLFFLTTSSSPPFFSPICVNPPYHPDPGFCFNPLLLSPVYSLFCQYPAC